MTTSAENDAHRGSSGRLGRVVAACGAANPPALRALLPPLAAVAFSLLACAESAPNLVLVTLDTTRADHLGCYGYELPTSPNLDRLAQDAVVYTRAYSTSSWTLPAHASLFTGKFPRSHGARGNPQGSLILGEAIASERGWANDYRADRLAPQERTLAQILAERGFATGAVVAGPWMKQVFGLDRGFEHYDEEGIASLEGRRAASVTDAALAWLDLQRDGPFFLFLNYFDPHAPHDDPEGYAHDMLPRGPALFTDDRLLKSALYRSACYDGEIRYMDQHLGRLLDGLRSRGLYEDAWIIVTSDHGELLGEHGYGHGSTLYEPEIRIPLIVKYPASRKRRGRNDAPIQLTAVLGLVLEGYGFTRPAEAGAPGGGSVFAELRPPHPEHVEEEQRILLRDGLKLHWRSDGSHRLFDLETDPRELEDLSGSEPARLREMQDALAHFVEALPVSSARGEPTVVDEETRRALRGLGYLREAPDRARAEP